MNDDEKTQAASEGRGDSLDSFNGSHDISETPTIASDTGPPAWSPLSDFSPAGAMVGNYRLEKRLGRGGFGDVYKAVDVKLDRPVALKFLRNAVDPKHQKLFEREAKAIARLSKHPNIVAIHTWGEYEGCNYFVMEYVPTSLEALVAKNSKGMSVPLSLRIALECAEALAYAHEMGVIHRDIKPANILLESEDGVAKIADFGLTRLLDSGEATLIEGISGSPPYMSPEQASGDPLDHRSDIFSLGVTLYQMLCGERPFEGVTSHELITRIRRNDRVPLAQRAGTLPDAVVRIVDKATAHQPSDRYQSAREFANALRAALQDINPDTLSIADSHSRYRPHKAPIKALKWAVVACIAIVLAAGLFQSSRQSEGPESGAPSIEELIRRGGELLSIGDAQGAQRAYAAVMEKETSSDPALYGMGYTWIRLGRPNDAANAFARMSDPVLKAEGEAAVARYMEGEAARQRIEAALVSNSTPYLKTLLASLDLSAQKYADVVAALGPIEKEDTPFSFGWQKEEALKTLGQAFYHLGQIDRAQSVFRLLEGAKDPGVLRMASAYARLVEIQADESRRQEAVTRAQQLRARLDEAVSSPATPQDAWTSRPYTFFVLPSRVVNSSQALDTGLADVLPMLLGDQLDQVTPMELVNRDMISDILMEQQLSAELSEGSNALRLGQLMGARFIVRAEFASAMEQEFVRMNIVDTETTKAVPAERFNLQNVNDPMMLVDILGRIVWQAVQMAYPLQGMVILDDGKLSLNIGRDLGVETRMRFALGEEPRADAGLLGMEAVVKSVGESTAEVEIPNEEDPQPPRKGWYARFVR